MAKKIKLSYPRDTVNSIQDITKKYIQDYFTYEVGTGKVSKEKLNEWIEIVKTAEENNPDNPVKAFNEYKIKFVDLYMPHLKRRNAKASDFFVSLLDKADKK